MALRTLIDRGEDPLGKRIAERKAPTVRDLAQRYIEEHATPKKRPASRRDDEAMVKQWIVPALAAKKVADIRHANIEKLHRRITVHGSTVRANRVADGTPRRQNGTLISGGSN